MSSDLISEQLKELYPLYIRVKEVIVLAEEFDPYHRIYLAPFNQLRSALDHIFKCFSDNPNPEYNFSELKEHLIRAGNDTFEILCSNFSMYITENISPFNMDVINQGFPDYYPIHKPIMVDLQTKIAQIRTHTKNSDPISIKSFNEYYTIFEKLQVIYKETLTRIPILIEIREKLAVEVRKKEKQNKRKNIPSNIFWKIIIPILIAIGGTAFGIWLKSKFFNN
jgi:hypothetical protein